MRLGRALLISAVVALSGIGLAIANNNIRLRPLARSQFQARLDSAAASARHWVLDQTYKPEPHALDDFTPEGRMLMANEPLLHMLVDCARLSGDPRLRAVLDAYPHVSEHPRWLARLVDPKAPYEPPPDRYMHGRANYLRWFVHAASPAGYALTPEDRADLFSPEKYRTGTATHQLLALYFYRKANGASPEIDAVIDQIARRIAVEAAIDFRVTDLYLQRVTFLLAAARPDLVRPRWVERALAAQHSDGGWTFTWHGWDPTPYRFNLDDESSTNHPTLQGLWLCLMLKYRYPDWIERNYR